MMMSDYRAFGECQKCILGAAAVLDLTSADAASQSVGGTAPKVAYKFAHILTLADTVLAGVKLAYDINAGTYAISLVGQTQVVGVTKLTVTSGQIEVLLFS